MIDSDRDSTSIIYNGNRIIFINAHKNRVTESCKCLIYGIVYNLVYEMM